MLVEFKFKNFRSFRDETTLSMEATGLGTYKNSLIHYTSRTKLLPGVAIFGKDGGGKSNIIRAFWLATQFIKNAPKTQHADASIPVTPFGLNEYSRNEPTEFEFIYVLDGVRYWYSFAATSKKIHKECLFHAPKGQKALVFSREEQSFTFTEEKARRKLIAETVAKNQLFFSVASTMNDEACVKAMRWFRERVFFSRGYSDIPQKLLEYSENPNMLKSISNYAKAADFGIEDMQFEINCKEVESLTLPDDMPEDLKNALTQFLQTISNNSGNQESKLALNEIKTTSFHNGIDGNGTNQLYPLGLADESDGTIRLMSYAPTIELTLNRGGVLLIDEIEKGLHPFLVDFIISKFQSKKSNPKGAQIIFTTHNIKLMNLDILRKDQLYFADKNRTDGSSELYSISEFGTKTTENILKGYIVGKYGAIPNIKTEEVY